MDYVIWGITIAAEILLLSVVVLFGWYRKLPWLTVTYALELVQSAPFIVMARYGTEREWWILFHFCDWLFAALFLCCSLESFRYRRRPASLWIAVYVLLKIPAWALLIAGRSEQSLAASGLLRYPFLALTVFLSFNLWHTHRQEETTHEQ